ncbi:MAG: tetratricopeptide repeat protein [Phaeodactylibacter sp.]|nr:tetratricopeptide repeat protein [Phaeodactylibacter sp.]MCB9265534.1 tetratricopeptide repeat protein [Lewinellaceae bacterium]MCB9288505.1 tetratricopeptide repeat protein [Lewinellaceae bacterium]
MARRKRNQKKADETLVDIVEVRDSAQSFIDENQKLIFGVLVALVLAVGGVFAYNNFYKKPRQAEAAEQMFKAQEQFERDSFALALTNPGGGYMGFLDIIGNYGGTAAGNTAKYYAGVSYLNLGKYQAAIDYLSDFSARGSIMPIMKYGAMGDAYSELKDFDSAMKYYKKAVNEGDNDFLTPYYLKKVGLLHEYNGNFAEAKKAYQEILAKYPDSQVGRDIEKYITRVEAKG